MNTKRPHLMRQTSIQRGVMSRTTKSLGTRMGQPGAIVAHLKQTDGVSFRSSGACLPCTPQFA